MGLYNLFSKQLSYNFEIGEVLEWKVKFYYKVKQLFIMIFVMIWEKIKENEIVR